MTRKFNGELEIDDDRGVIYFHVDDHDTALEHGSVSILRICNLPTPIPKRALDVTHLVGCDWDGRPGKFKRESQEVAVTPGVVTLKIPFAVGDEGSVQAWGYAIKGESKHNDVDIGICIDSIPDDEYKRSGIRQGMIVVEIPVAAMFKKTEFKGKVEC